MSRSYKGIRAKKHRVYSGEDLQKLYGVSANTISNWVQAGLKPSDGAKPYVFKGAVVGQFHKGRRERAKTHLGTGEFKCRRCKLAVTPEMETVTEKTTRTGTIMLHAQCPECLGHLVKVSTQADRAMLALHRNPNTTGDCRHEENTLGPGGVGIKAKLDVPKRGSVNDRIIHKWQEYAGRYDTKTVDQHLAAIRFFEEETEGKRFDQLKTADAAKVREALKHSLTAKDGPLKSKSSVAHIASHLKSFFVWLLKQQGFKRLPADIADYFVLPNSVYAKSLPRKPKNYPSVKAAEELLLHMPTRSVMDRRARAIFALAFLGALRADTLVSLQIGHFDFESKRIVQDATAVRAKNGKSLIIQWFPIPNSFADVVIDWVEELLRAGFCQSDALFPSKDWLSGAKKPKTAGRANIMPMTTTHAVTEAFAIACRDSSNEFTPHSAKHTIAAERDVRALTQEQRKAWSENMGHETEQITQSHYGNLSDGRRAELFEEISQNKTLNPSELSDEQKIEFFDRLLEFIAGNQ